jgi:hypothetical protein
MVFLEMREYLPPYVLSLKEEVFKDDGPQLSLKNYNTYIVFIPSEITMEEGKIP